MRRSSRKSSDFGETQWTGRLVEIACKHGFKDLVRLGQAGADTEAEFNRICAGKKMRAWLPGGAPGDFGFWLIAEKPWGMPEALKLAHYAASRALLIVCGSAWASLDWWRDALSEMYEIVEIEDLGGHIVILARPMHLVGEIKTKGAVSHEERRHNMRLNCRYFRGRLTPPNFTGGSLPRHGRKAILVCAGPSLRSTWGAIRMSQDMGTGGELIVSCSMAYRFLVDHGVRPHVHIETDPRGHKVDQLQPIDPAGTEFWLDSCVSPAWQDHVPESSVLLWHGHNGPESVTAVEEVDPGRGQLCGGGSVGLRAISCLYFKGFRHLDIHGMDCSFDADGEQHAGAHLGKPMPEIVVTHAKREFRTSPIMVAYARFFGKLVEMIPDMEINLAGDGLLQAMHGRR